MLVEQRHAGLGRDGEGLFTGLIGVKYGLAAYASCRGPCQVDKERPRRLRLCRRVCWQRQEVVIVIWRASVRVRNERFGLTMLV